MLWDKGFVQQKLQYKRITKGGWVKVFNMFKLTSEYMFYIKTKNLQIGLKTSQIHLCTFFIKGHT